MKRSLTELNIHNLRNIASARLNLHPQRNIFYGANGSGKTSLLEAIYLLSSGHSFRTREISPLIKDDEQILTVFARTSTNESISIQKELAGPTQVKLNMHACYSSSELAHFLPCQVFYQDIFQIIDAGPGVRRALLDWGVFHVEQSYNSIWKKYRLVVKQRNALLRQRAVASQFIPWDMQLVNLATELDRMRSAYFEQWSHGFQDILARLTDVPCTISYYKGWDRKQIGHDLKTILQEQLETDLNRQYTQAGAHQADIVFDLSSKKAKRLLSRGQQKIVLIALKLAQASLLEFECVYLFDDVHAELDSIHFLKLVDELSSIKGQIFFTGIDDTRLNENYKLCGSAYRINNGLFEQKL